MRDDTSLADQHAACVERWKILREELRSINYTFEGLANKDGELPNGLAVWLSAKEIQFGIVIGQPITRESIARLEELLTETHGVMFFDAIALGQRK